MQNCFIALPHFIHQWYLRLHDQLQVSKVVAASGDFHPLHVFTCIVCYECLKFCIFFSIASHREWQGSIQGDYQNSILVTGNLIQYALDISIGIKHNFKHIFTTMRTRILF